MTVPLPLQSTTAKGGDAATIQKRRRRAPTGGAADNCFSCSKRNLKCDRRRPYCSQCLDMGSKCSGYKTQLTWGVGVASRGKLRGLSLPIAKAPRVNQGSKKGSPTRSPGGSVAAAAPWNDSDAVSSQGSRDDVDMSRDLSARELSISLPPTPFHLYGISHMSQAKAVSPVSPGHWAHMPFSAGSLPAETLRFPKLATHLAGHPDTPLSSIDSLSDADYHMSTMSRTLAADGGVSSSLSPTVQYRQAAVLVGGNTRAPCPSGMSRQR